MVVKGFIGPDAGGVAHVVVDSGLDGEAGWVAGANAVDTHVTGFVLSREVADATRADLVVVNAGDQCPQCGGALAIDRGIEVGHCFQLGTKYSKAMGAQFVDEVGATHPMVMGCYGIGVSRVVAAVLEQHHDEQGMKWPKALAPYAVHLVVLAGKGDAAIETRAAADRVYEELRAARVEVLYDDRDASPGVKFADADLLGMPLQITVGAKGLARGVAETKDRATGERGEVTIAEIAAFVITSLGGAVAPAPGVADNDPIRR